MSEGNPYQAPDSNVSMPNDSSESILASRWQRLGAAILDGLISLVWTIPLFFGLGIIDLIMKGQQAALVTILIASAISWVIYILVQGYFLKTNGQTLGKKLLGIQIVSLDGALLSLASLLSKRYLPIWIVSVIPIAGSILPLVDVLFIFRDDKRCVHDLIAGTKVVRCHPDA